ncbi:class I SAM-dependent methyltransferase [Nocardia harenae]|uniref:class I SAM-dependent methyltransferase n=1 Tax=Nocardia harenae TaxID=358707 RepID=UPI000832EE26|nr:class I SAM-dependent methyltransferase [Nocardia harenae]
MPETTERWDSVYDDDTAPWVIGRPQPAIAELERAGAFTGRVLDIGCGAGEHTILLTERGHDVLGVDFSPRAIDVARGNAESKGVPEARFAVADALALGTDPHFTGAYDTVLDSALFHIWGTEPEVRARYVRSLHGVLRPGGVLRLLALSDAEPGFGPRIGAEIVRGAFADGWRLVSLEPARYLGRITPMVADNVAGLAVSPAGLVEAAAWVAEIRRS